MYNLYKFGKEGRTRLLRQSTLRSWRGICQTLIVLTALCSLNAKAAWYQFSSIAGLRAQSTSGLVDGDLAFTTGYYSASDRGGGWFTWQAARAGSYYDGRAGGSVSFLDIYVERSLDSGQPLTLSHPFSGEGEDAGMGETELLAPTAPLTSLLPPNCTLNVCVTNVLTR
jgi:hypothetical protein